MVRNHFILFLLCSTLAGCAGFNRGCSSWSARSFGADWVVVELGLDGTPYRCWTLNNVSITNEPSSDGIYWKDTATGNLVHISGSYDYVQVEGRNFEAALNYLGLDRRTCETIRTQRYNVETGAYESTL